MNNPDDSAPVQHIYSIFLRGSAVSAMIMVSAKKGCECNLAEWVQMIMATEKSAVSANKYIWTVQKSLVSAKSVRVQKSVILIV